MLIPILFAGGGAYVSHKVTEKVEEEKTGKKLDLIKRLAELTPDQARAVDALKRQTVEEMELRVRTGIGPFQPLPPQAAARAQEIRSERLAAVQPKIDAALARLTPAERAAVASDPGMQREFARAVAADIAVRPRA